MKKILVLLFALLFPQLADAQSTFNASSQIAVKSVLVANNTTAVVIKPSGGTVYSIDAFNNSATIAYVKLYNTTGVTCGTGTPYARYMIPFGASSSGGGFSIPNINGDAYLSGITLCVTTGIADNDTGAPAAGAYIVNIHYK